MKTIKIILIITIIFILDRLSKILVIDNLSLGESLPIIKNFFNITYVNNHGAAFGILDGKIVFIVLISIIIFAYLIYEIKKGIHNNLITTSISLVIGGLLGNLFDRLVYGHVIDFLDFDFWNYDFAIFNIGDSFIVFGTILFAIGLIMEDKNENRNNWENKQ